MDIEMIKLGAVVLGGTLLMFAFVVLDYYAAVSLSRFAILQFRIAKHGKVYAEIQSKILEALADGSIKHNLDLRFSSDEFIYNPEVYEKVLADLVKSGDIKEVVHLDSPTTMFYATKAADVEDENTVAI